jgi:TonB family protein
VKSTGVLLALACTHLLSGRTWAPHVATPPTYLVQTAPAQTPSSLATSALTGWLVQVGRLGGLRTELQFDSRGVDFGLWLRSFIVQLRGNWVLPYRAMSLRGSVTVSFTVHTDGAITDSSVSGPSPIDVFNDAATRAVTVSNPAPRLPAEYPAEQVSLKVTFVLNESAGQDQAAPWPPPGIYEGGSEGVTPPRVLREGPPQYTPDATRAGIEGTVLVEGLVLPNGSMTAIHVIRQLDPKLGLDDAAIRAVYQWQFAPGTRLGEPVPVITTVEVPFTLKR